jgi:hypothetical protein
MLELFVHLKPPIPRVISCWLPPIPDELEREQIEASDLPANWRESPSPRSRKVRRRFCEAGRVLPIAGALGAGGHRKGLLD